MSCAFTPRASRLSSEVKVKPVIASTSPRASMVSRSGGALAGQVAAPMPLGFLEIGEARGPASHTGGPLEAPVQLELDWRDLGLGGAQGGGQRQRGGGLKEGPFFH